MPKHVAIYIRVSSKKQDQRSQLADLERWESAFSETVIRYSDKQSGRTMDRPGWRRLEAALRRGEISKIVVWRLDRLGRTASGLTTLFDELQNRKVGLVSLRDGIDLETPAGRLMANVLASVAAYENEVRAERVIAGQAAARAAGKRWGGSTFGIRKKVTQEQVDVIRQMKLDGKAIARIAQTVGLSRPTVYDVLRDSSTSR
jgi:DNA invertase Pin-like site-specific DNA recombinase